jgi:hypothetical protein
MYTSVHVKTHASNHIFICTCRRSAKAKQEEKRFVNSRLMFPISYFQTVNYICYHIFLNFENFYTLKKSGFRFLKTL